MHHGRGDEMQRARAERKRIALAHNQPAIFVLRAEKLPHHGKRLRRSDDLRVWISFHEHGDVCGVIGLHVLHDEIIGLSAAQNALQIFQPFAREMRVHRIHHGDFFVFDDVGIITHAVRHFVLTFE